MKELARRLPAYSGPAFVHVVAVFVLWWASMLELDFGAGLALVIYLLASFWWFVRAVQARARLWPDGALIWIPALPWLGLTLAAALDAMKDDLALVSLVVVAVPTLGYVLACVAVTIRLWLRDRRSPTVG